MGMQDKEGDIVTLVELGLNKTQARIYLALVERGMLPIRMVSEYSGVGRPETYRAVLELNHRGLVETVLASPTTYKPLPLQEVVNILMAQKQQEMSELKGKSEKLLQEYQKKTINPVAFVEREFVLLPKGSGGVKKAASAIKAAQSSIDFVISIKKFNQLLLAASEELVEATNRGVKIRFILDKNNLNKSLSEIFALFHNTASFKYIDELPQPFTVIFDKKSVLMATTGDDFAQTSMLWSNNAVLVGTIQNYFKLLWGCNQSNIFQPLNETLEENAIEIVDDYKSLDAPIL